MLSDNSVTYLRRVFALDRILKMCLNTSFHKRTLDYKFSIKGRVWTVLQHA